MLAYQIFPKATKVLYMSHLAIGDYIYQRTFLQQVRQKYPQLQLDIWLDDFRPRPKAWSAGRASLLKGWLESESFIDRVYPLAKDEAHRQQLLQMARSNGYDAVFFIATARSSYYAKYARFIADKSYCSGLKPSGVLSPIGYWRFSRLDDCVPDDFDGSSIHRIYGQRFQALTGIKPAIEVAPLTLNGTAVRRVNRAIANWHKPFGTQKSVLVNHLSTTYKRDYSWTKMVDVIEQLAKVHPECLFIINTPPHQKQEVESLTKSLSKERGLACVASSSDGVFELAAMVQAVNAVLTVETAIAHLASVFDKPQVTLMRQQSAHWCPPNASKVLFSSRYINDIPPEKVTDACVKHFFV
ncbi:hypothetical protein HMF8227_00052 [Saliniradius amylolyticus]|uniref:Uncharacterized protein n=1 Tax=Saliniradius amylolyticus TaxID=2183582 RepID=A0A2S2DZW2_9ALTE|nr:glycosyltransferase family 9 protein [Saliniradius amylolyticus]AWL10560.1 hypothetical protein HMF8227_00052 [Saliniradius amylolyticus]